MDNVQRQHFGRHAGFDWKLGPNQQPFAATDPIARPHRTAIDTYGAGADPALQPGPGILWQRRSQRLIEAQASRRRRQVELVDLELRGHR